MGSKDQPSGTRLCTAWQVASTSFLRDKHMFEDKWKGGGETRAPVALVVKLAVVRSGVVEFAVAVSSSISIDNVVDFAVARGVGTQAC